MHNIVVGSGPAAAAAILALADDPAEQITVVDIGERLSDADCSGDRPDERTRAGAVGCSRSRADHRAACPTRRCGASREARVRLEPHVRRPRPAARDTYAKAREQCRRIRRRRWILDRLGRTDHAVFPRHIRPLAVWVGRHRAALSRRAGGGAAGRRSRRLCGGFPSALGALGTAAGGRADSGSARPLPQASRRDPRERDCRRQGATRVRSGSLCALRDVHDRLPVLADLLGKPNDRPVRRKRSGQAYFDRSW